MPEPDREQKLQILDKLPADLQTVFTSETTAVILHNLRKKYSIPDEKSGDLARTVGNVILGLLPLTNLAQEINTKITPDMQIALHLAQELNVELFFPVIESLKQAPVIANAVLTGLPVPQITPAPVPQAVPAPAPALRPVAPASTLVPSSKFQVPSSVSTDQYRETAEVMTGPLKPKIGPEVTPIAPRPVAPPVVTLRPLETMTAPSVSSRQAPKPMPAPVPRPAPTPMPAPQPIKVPLPTPPAVAPAPIKVPVAPMPTPSPAAPAAPRPLTFTRPVMPPMPVQAPVPAALPAQFPIPKPDTYREPVEIAPLPVPPQLPITAAGGTPPKAVAEEMAHPTGTPAKQFITSPAGTLVDLEEPASDIIDLRQDRGKF